MVTCEPMDQPYVFAASPETQTLLPRGIGPLGNSMRSGRMAVTSIPLTVTSKVADRHATSTVWVRNGYSSWPAT